MAEELNDGSPAAPVAAEDEITFINRSVEIVDEADPVAKVAKFARLCYRSESNAGREGDVRIIQNCIKNGHTSVLEHAAISVVLPRVDTPATRITYGKLAGKPDHRVSIPPLGPVFQSSAVREQLKYVIDWFDPSAALRKAQRDGKELPQGAGQGAECYLADIRAWREIVDSRIAFATGHDLAMLFAFAAELLYILNKAAPEFFFDIVDRFDNKFLPTFDRLKLDLHSDIERIVFNRIQEGVKKDEEGIAIEATPLTLQMIHDYFWGQNEDEIYAVPADKSATFSYILKTDRATTHQHVRHRDQVGYSQESQRYVNYDKKGFEFLIPSIDPTKAKTYKVIASGELDLDAPENDQILNGTHESVEGQPSFTRKNDGFKYAAATAVKVYSNLVNQGVPPETARWVLPNGVATRLGVTWLGNEGLDNFVFWRLEKHAEIDIRYAIAHAIVGGLKAKLPYFQVKTPGLIKHWLELIKEQNLAPNENLDELIEFENKREEAIQRYLEDRRQKIEAARKAQEEAQKKEIEARIAAQKAEQAAAAAEATPESPAAEVITPKEGETQGTETPAPAGDGEGQQGPAPGAPGCTCCEK